MSSETRMGIEHSTRMPQRSESGVSARYETKVFSPVMIEPAGVDGEFDFANKVFLEFTGRRMDEKLGIGWAEDVHPEDLQRCLEIHLTAFCERRLFQIEYRLRRHDGEYRWILDTGVPPFDADGRFVGYIGSINSNYSVSRRNRFGDLDATQKNLIARAITRVRSESSGAPQLFQVIIDKNKSVDRCLGGHLTANHVWVRGDVPAGRTEDQRKTLIPHHDRGEPNRRYQRGVNVGISVQPPTG
jgi:PAS domain S-box-containing protein